MADQITRTEYVTLGSGAGATPLATPAWLATNIDTLWNAGKVRGSDRIIPGAVGSRPYRRIAATTARTLEMVVFGAQDRTGAYNADPRLGLWNNIKILRALVAPTVTSGSGGTTWCSLVLPTSSSPSTLTGWVHVEGFDISPIHRHTVRATMDLSFPYGQLT